MNQFQETALSGSQIQASGFAGGMVTPGYGDLTVALHDELFGVRDGVVETVFTVLGRGRLQ